MDLQYFLPICIKKFDKWYAADPQRKNRDAYDTTVTKSYLESLSKEQFFDFFYEFVREGGRIQSGGNRTKNLFIEMLQKDFESFKLFILKPFNPKFDLEAWFTEINAFSYFGVGIATIFLNRVDRNTYAIMNNKTINALRELGYKVSSSKNFKNYQTVWDIQKELMKQFPLLLDFCKTDSLNHFLIGTGEGRNLLLEFKYKTDFEDNLEQEELALVFEDDSSLSDKKALLQKIKETKNSGQEKLIINSSSYKRDNYQIALIKKFHGYKCQFCHTTIAKEDGGYYIEACHIHEKAKGGDESLNNILVLCPNCHKLLDYGKKEILEHTESKFSVKLNEKCFCAFFEDSNE